MKKSLVIGIVLISVLLIMPLAFAGEMTTEITGECIVYDRGIEYERCCPMGVKINCVRCRDTDGGRNYYVKGETQEQHWNRFEMGMLVSGGPGVKEGCIEIIPLTECPGTIIKEATDDSYGLCELYQQIKLYGEIETPGEEEQCEVNCRTNVCFKDDECLGRCLSECWRDDGVTVLKEGYCKWVGEYQLLRSEEYICPNGCVDGACIRDDGCPTAIGWRIEGIKCLVDTGCNYDSSKDYYDSAEECIKGLGKVEYPVLEPLAVPDICSDLLIEKNIAGYNYRETKYSRMGPDVYSEDGKQIGTTKCCVAYYKKNVIDIMGSVAYVCSYDNREYVENSVPWITNEDYYELGEYMNQAVYWMRRNSNEAILWTNNNNILVVGNEAGGAIPGDIAEAYFEKHNSDLGDVDVEIVTPEPTEEEEEPIEEPIDIPEEKMFYSCTGCELRGKCYPIGYRKEGRYCSDNNEFVSQMSEGGCDNNFECKSNVCISDECVKEGLIKRIIKWFKNLFGA